jgi:translation initiation factor 5B
LYWENKKNNDPEDYISLVPTSGVTGEGIPDLLTMIVDMCFTTEEIREKLLIKSDQFQCSVMEVKVT